MKHPMRFARRRAARSQHRGSSLIEVLVAALLLAIGMLSLAGLQASALRLTKEAEFRATSSEIAFAFSEAVKANVGGMAQYTNASNTFVVNPGAVAVPTSCNGIANVCTPAQIATQDLARVLELARNRMPSGQIVAQFVAGAGGLTPTPPSIDLWVAWLPADNRSGTAAVDAQVAQNCPTPGYDATNAGVHCQYFRIVP
jgi:type IV pilus assembly protein PilV